MKKITYLLALPLFLLLSSCQKDQETVPKPSSGITEADYNAFLKQTSPQFRGNINGKDFLWQKDKFSSVIGRCEYDLLRELNFGLVAQSSKNYFRLYLPHYNFREETDFNRVFAPGKKKMGDVGNDFHLEITVNDQFLVTSSLSTINELEIIKTEEYTREGLQEQNGVNVPYSEKYMRIWVKVNAELRTCSSCPNAESVTLNGLIIGEVNEYQGEI